MKVLIELPDGWLDADLMGNLEWVSRTVRQQVREQIAKALADQVDLPKLEFTAEEMRPLVANILAERKADELWHERNDPLAPTNTI